MKDYQALLKDLEQETVEMVSALVKIPSVKGEAAPGAPFGQAARDALDFFLEHASVRGFRTKNLDGYAGWIEFGEGEEMVAVLAHLDVVPVADGWTFPAFSGEVSNNCIYGRGTQDDKGPAVTAYMAMRAIRDSGMKLGRRVRLILGCDEENDSRCIARYKETEELPVAGFTPDSDFPLIFAEKGIAPLELTFPFLAGKTVRILSVEGGSRHNMVAPLCDAVIAAPAETLARVQSVMTEAAAGLGFGLTLQEAEGQLKLRTTGVSAHGSMPEKGVNAISRMLEILRTALEALGEPHPGLDLWKELLGFALDGSGLGITMSDEPSGHLSVNVGIVSLKHDTITFTLDIRHPVTVTTEAVMEKLTATLAGRASWKPVMVKAPLYIPLDSPLVSALLKAYRDETGDTETPPISTGGGTYARTMPNLVAYGMLFPGEEEYFHQNDERVSIDSLHKATRIYARALISMAE